MSEKNKTQRNDGVKIEEVKKNKLKLNDAPQAVLWLTSGIILISLRNNGILPGLLIGSMITYIGFHYQKENKNFLAKMVIATGLVTLVSGIPLLGKVSNVILFISGLGLIGAGVVKLFQYILKRNTNS